MEKERKMQINCQKCEKEFNAAEAKLLVGESLTVCRVCAVKYNKERKG